MVDEPCSRLEVEAAPDNVEVSCELSSTTPEDFHPFTWIPGREAWLKKLAAPPKWGVANSFHFNSVNEPTERGAEEHHADFITPIHTFTASSGNKYIL